MIETKLVLWKENRSQTPKSWIGQSSEKLSTSVVTLLGYRIENNSI